MVGQLWWRTVRAPLDVKANSSPCLQGGPSCCVSQVCHVFWFCPIPETSSTGQPLFQHGVGGQSGPHGHWGLPRIPGCWTLLLAHPFTIGWKFMVARVCGNDEVHSRKEPQNPSHDHPHLGKAGKLPQTRIRLGRQANACREIHANSCKLMESLSTSRQASAHSSDQATCLVPLLTYRGGVSVPQPWARALGPWGLLPKHWPWPDACNLRAKGGVRVKGASWWLRPCQMCSHCTEG